MIRFLFLLTLMSGAVRGAWGLDQVAVDALAKSCYDIDRGKDSTLLCKMAITNDKGTVENRELAIQRQSWQERYRNLTKFNLPNDIKGTGFLTWSYRDKEDVQWLYLPALKQVRKISLGSKHNSFVGTDFSYDDMRERKVSEDDFSYLKEGEMDGAACTVLVATPKSTSGSEYQKMELFIRKDNNYLVGVRYFKKDSLYKLFQAGDLKQVEGVWVAHRLEMKNVEKRTKTLITVTDAKINKGLPDDIFTERNLEK